jgi:hypothetical protein
LSRCRRPTSRQASLNCITGRGVGRAIGRHVRRSDAGRAIEARGDRVFAEPAITPGADRDDQPDPRRFRSVHLLPARGLSQRHGIAVRTETVGLLMRNAGLPGISGRRTTCASRGPSRDESGATTRSAPPPLRSSGEYRTPGASSRQPSPRAPQRRTSSSSSEGWLCEAPTLNDRILMGSGGPAPSSHQLWRGWSASRRPGRRAAAWCARCTLSLDRGGGTSRHGQLPSSGGERAGGAASRQCRRVTRRRWSRCSRCQQMPVSDSFVTLILLPPLSTSCM